MTATAPPVVANPYVGPRPFEPGERLYGRDAEIGQLADLVLSERIVLLYSPSGAGKTSLIQAGLIPRLASEDFRVLPSIRVNLEVDRDPGAGSPPNRYLRSAVSSLEGAGSPERLDELARMPFGEYLDQRPRAAGEPNEDVLVFDQFEELLTLDPTDGPAKQEFMAHVGFALRDRHRWALFSMREEYIAGLDPYGRLVPTRLSTTFRLDLLKRPQALLAIQEPARDRKPSFTEGAANALFDQLCRVRVQRPDGWKDEPGEYVEPVQLQVVCRRLWEKMAESEEIGAGDVEALGDIQTALGDYYDEKVPAITVLTGASERVIREWFDEITEQGIRAQVLQGPSAENAQGVLRELENAHLIRAETRRGSTWFELAHDRLIEPVRQRNAEWRQSHLSPLQRQAALWSEQNRLDGLLLRDEALDAAESWVAAQTGDLTTTETDFLTRCQELRAEVARHERQARVTRGWAILASVVSVLAVLASALALVSGNRAREQRGIAATRALVAGSALSLGSDANLSILLARWAVEPVFKAIQQVRPEAAGALFEAVHSAPARTRVGPLGQATSRVAFSPDGTRLAMLSGKVDAVSVVDTASGKLVQTISGGDGTVWDLAFSPDGTRLVTANSERTATVWDLNGKALFTLAGHSDQVYAVAFGPGGTIATASKDTTARVWDGTGRELRVLAGHSAPVSSIAFSHDGRLLVTASEDKTAKIWDEASGRELHSLAGHGDRIREASFSPDDTLVATASFDRSAGLWDVASGDRVRSLDGHRGFVFDVAFSPDGRQLATGSDDRTARLWDVGSGESRAELQPATGTVTDVTFSPSGGQLAISTIGGALALWDLREPFRQHTLRVTSVAVSPSGRELASSSNDGTVKLWDVATGTVVRTFQHPDGVTSVAFSPDGRLLATASKDKIARLWEVATGKELRQLSGHDNIVWYLAFNPKGDMLATVGEDKAVRLWNVASGSATGVLTGHANGINSVAFSPDGKHLVTTSNDKTAKVWNVAQRKLERTLSGHTEFVYDAAFSPDGEEIATAGQDKTVRLWSTTSGKEKRRFDDHTEPVWDLSYSPDGDLLASASSDRSVIVHNLRADLTLRIPGAAEMTATSFGSSDEELIAGDASGRVYVYPLELRPLLNMADKRTTRALSPEECRRFLGVKRCPRDLMSQPGDVPPT